MTKTSTTRGGGALWRVLSRFVVGGLNTHGARAVSFPTMRRRHQCQPFGCLWALIAFALKSWVALIVFYLVAAGTVVIYGRYFG